MFAECSFLDLMMKELFLECLFSGPFDFRLPFLSHDRTILSKSKLMWSLASSLKDLEKSNYLICVNVLPGNELCLKQNSPKQNHFFQGLETMCSLTLLRNMTKNTGSAFRKDLALLFTGNWDNFSFLMCKIGILVSTSKSFCEDEILSRK